MKIIDTRIETMQIELLEASKEIKRCTNCYNGHLLLDTLGGRFDTYTNPEEALANKAFMMREIIDEKDSECDGSTCMRVSVVVDVFKRDNDEPRFSPCDENEVSDAIEYYYKARKEAENTKQEEANKEDDGLTMIEGLPYKANKLVYHNEKEEKPLPFMTVIALTENGCWFSGSYEDGCWKYANGSVFDHEAVGGYVVAWFCVPVLQKV